MATLKSRKHMSTRGGMLASVQSSLALSAIEFLYEDLFSCNYYNFRFHFP